MKQQYYKEYTAAALYVQTVQCMLKIYLSYLPVSSCQWIHLYSHNGFSKLGDTFLSFSKGDVIQYVI